MALKNEIEDIQLKPIQFEFTLSTYLFMALAVVAIIIVNAVVTNYVKRLG